MKQIYDMLKLENIKILPGVKDWKEAIYTAVKPLVDGGYCEARYSDEIIKNTEKLGPYYVLCENVALVHGSTEQGVIKRQIAITLLKEPVKFKEDGCKNSCHISGNRCGVAYGSTTGNVRII